MTGIPYTSSSSSLSCIWMSCSMSWSTASRIASSTLIGSFDCELLRCAVRPVSFATPAVLSVVPVVSVRPPAAVADCSLLGLSGIDSLLPFTLPVKLPTPHGVCVCPCVCACPLWARISCTRSTGTMTFSYSTSWLYPCTTLVAASARPQPSASHHTVRNALVSCQVGRGYAISCRTRRAARAAKWSDCERRTCRTLKRSVSRTRGRRREARLKSGTRRWCESEKNAPERMSSGRGEGNERGRVGCVGSRVDQIECGRIASKRNTTSDVRGTRAYSITVRL